MKKTFKILTVIFFATLSLVLILLSINIFRYQKWEKLFESNLENVSIEEIPIDVEEIYLDEKGKKHRRQIRRYHRRVYRRRRGKRRRRRACVRVFRGAAGCADPRGEGFA